MKSLFLLIFLMPLTGYVALAQKTLKSAKNPSFNEKIKTAYLIINFGYSNYKFSVEWAKELAQEFERSGVTSYMDVYDYLSLEHDSMRTVRIKNLKPNCIFVIRQKQTSGSTTSYSVTMFSPDQQKVWYTESSLHDREIASYLKKQVPDKRSIHLIISTLRKDGLL